MAKVFCIGETVFDIIFKNFVPITAKGGGSMLNSAITMGRMGLPVYFITEYGFDAVGDEIEKFLLQNNVNTQYVYRYRHGKTSIALAFLNPQNEASYSFYKDLPTERLQNEFPIVNADDYVLFGSFYSINKEVRTQLIKFIHSANDAGATIIYDPNFRRAHLPELNELKSFIIENMCLATIVRGSHEDFNMIFETNTVDETFQYIANYCNTIIYTQNIEGVYFMQSNRKIYVPSRQIIPVSTIGAGDNFNAGVLYYLFTKNLNGKYLYQQYDNDIYNMLKTGVDFASEVCLSFDNYVSFEFAQTYTCGF